MTDYSLSLIPSDDYSERIRSLSAGLELGFGEFQPHVTVLACEQPITFAGDIVIELAAAGYYCDIDEKQRVWHGLKLQQSDELMALRDDLTTRYGSDATTGRVYFPHMTLGCTSVDTLDDITLGALKQLAGINGAQSFRLRFCRNGEFGKVVEILQ